ncbi:putative Metallothionein, family 15, plant [Helianthus annuus]|uniref:Metallothionein-like protein n=1 Tax=Helianthus annuus TaxID=4232 RepID=A0A251U8C0_HELAN|nr:metallothionein-like protein type 2 [Helianthus annuus]KAF5797162.1 putative Metallothionein, family 15, plant [Helianthus annuus]KAJ0540387.1 putative Metallothionein, family 15, plant [Helianthus annuus]KAJ0555128.1 putative Metallothionein, family 15, plant [Helianthus annuus]KAJ0720696.1 putative Metallothionein, family 15, plant [Helianthus annuus]KAJ0723878.1 putative Metallothionein, family 15, plant [Helianthus annuus]
MSCCSGKCGCGSSCSCGSGCNGCGMYPDVEVSSTTVMIVDGVAPKQMFAEGSEGSFVAEGGNCNCKCGDNCKCGNNCSC